MIVLCNFSHDFSCQKILVWICAQNTFIIMPVEDRLKSFKNKGKDVDVSFLSNFDL